MSNCAIGRVESNWTLRIRIYLLAILALVEACGQERAGVPARQELGAGDAQVETVSDSQVPDPYGCLAQHGLQPATDADAASVTAECMSDTGPCQASIPCDTPETVRDCDRAKIISSAAAVCIAEAAGIMTGLSGLSASLAYNHRERRIVWNVMNTLSHTNTALGVENVGEQYEVDAITGDLLLQSHWSETP